MPSRLFEQTQCLALRRLRSRVLFFHLIARPTSPASTNLVSVTSSEEWGDVFRDEVMATALIDRLLNHCHIIDHPRRRMRHHTELWRSLNHGDFRPPPPPLRRAPPING